MAIKDDRMVDDLTDEEYEDFERNPENWEDVIDNTNEYYRDMMGIDDDE
ncbi:MAG: hypothetical protein NC095_02950 [Muribaculum sp.]|nr:hypothetical protein [Muribaculum sp.]